MNTVGKFPILMKPKKYPLKQYAKVIFVPEESETNYIKFELLHCLL